MEIRILSPAKVELDESYAYYESQQTGLGQKFLDEVFLQLIVSKWSSLWRSRIAREAGLRENSIFFL
jgi:hypothetical protein